MDNSKQKDRGYWLAAELGKRAGVSDARIRQLLLDGKIKGNKAGSTWTIPYNEGLRWLATRGVEV